MLNSKKPSSHYELYFAFFVIILGFVALVMAFGFSPRARILPIPVAMLLIILGLTQVFQMMRQMMRKKPQEETREVVGAVCNKYGKGSALYKEPLLMTLALIGLFPFLLNFMGFVVTAIFTMGYLMYLRGIKSRVTIAAFSTVTPIIIYYLFSVVGGASFPKGPWGF